MYQFECGSCGYDMTGIERFTNTIDLAAYGSFGEMTSTLMSGFYNTSFSSTITCPNCGKSGYWIKH